MAAVATTQPPTVTVIAATYDRRPLLAKLLDGLVEQTYPAERLNIVIIDNGTKDGSSADLARWQGIGRDVLTFADNVPVALARNQALVKATGEIVAFTDDDCVPDPNWIEELVAPFDDSRVGIVQGRTVPVGRADPPRTVTQDIPELSGLYETCNVAYRRQALQQHGGFPARLGFFGEDTDAAWRLLEAGWQARFAAAAHVRHAVNPGGLRWHIERYRGYRNWPALIRAHPGMRDELLWRRWFLSRRTACVDGAVVGVVAWLATRRRWPLVMTVPYVVARAPRRGGRQGVRDLVTALVVDGVTLGALSSGSIRERCLVL